MCSQVLYRTAFDTPAGGVHGAVTQPEKKLPRPLRLAVISGLALASWTPLLLLLA